MVSKSEKTQAKPSELAPSCRDLAEGFLLAFLCLEDPNYCAAEHKTPAYNETPLPGLQLV